MQRSDYTIDVSDAQSRVAIDPARLASIAADLLQHEAVASAEISVALIDGGTMRELNRQHLDHDYDTDVLSFLLECDGPATSRSDASRGAGKAIEGEVLISTDVAAKAAEEFGWSIESEVILYLVHGLLHLVGYDDLSDDEKEIMRERERYHLARWDLHPVYAEPQPESAGEEMPADDPTFFSSDVRG
jgi:probable rRNA maturation factor